MPSCSPTLVHVRDRLEAWLLTQGAALRAAGLDAHAVFDVPTVPDATPLVGIRYAHRDGATLVVLVDGQMPWAPDVRPWLSADAADRARVLPHLDVRSAATTPGDPVAGGPIIRPVVQVVFPSAPARTVEDAVEALHRAIAAQVFHAPGAPRVRLRALADPEGPGARVLCGARDGALLAEWIVRVERPAPWDEGPTLAQFRVTSTITLAALPVGRARHAVAAELHRLAGRVAQGGIPVQWAALALTLQRGVAAAGFWQRLGRLGAVAPAFLAPRHALVPHPAD